MKTITITVEPEGVDSVVDAATIAIALKDAYESWEIKSASGLKVTFKVLKLGISWDDKK